MVMPNSAVEMIAAVGGGTEGVPDMSTGLEVKVLRGARW